MVWFTKKAASARGWPQRCPPYTRVHPPGYLLSTITDAMKSPQDLGRIALGFLKADPDRRHTLDAGLALQKALRSCRDQELEYGISDIE